MPCIVTIVKNKTLWKKNDAAKFENVSPCCKSGSMYYLLYEKSDFPNKEE